MKSMTGYGKGVAEQGGRQVVIELKSVNHRFLDLNIKMPKTFCQFEDLIRKSIQQYIERGHIDVFVNYFDLTAQSNCFKANIELAKNYLAEAARLSAEVGIEDDLTLTSLLKVPEIIERCETEIAAEEIEKLILKSITEALENIDIMKENEGAAIAEDTASKLNIIEGFVQKISERAPFVVGEYREKLEKRVSELVKDAAVNMNRLEEEIAIYSDRCSIDEELTRLTAHIKQLYKYIATEGAAGRKIDFLIQEMNREANTIGSKANDIIITQTVLKLKNEIEKIREQAQNIE